MNTLPVSFALQTAEILPLTALVTLATPLLVWFLVYVFRLAVMNVVSPKIDALWKAHNGVSDRISNVEGRLGGRVYELPEARRRRRERGDHD